MRQQGRWNRGLAMLLAATMVGTLLAGCGSTAADTADAEAEATQAETADATASIDDTEVSDHAPLTMTTRSSSDYHEFIEALHEAYPEVNIELISYVGANTTGYSNVQLQAGDISDIFAMSYPPSEELQEANLLDLSGEDFISNINLKTLSDLSVNGAVYLMPTKMTLFAVYYNKTLFEEHGWTVPNSMAELEALIPQIEEAGVRLADTCTQYAGSAFSYFFDVNAPDYFTTLDGISWMQAYLAGTATAKGNLEPQVERFQELIDLGMLPMGDADDDDVTTASFREGNTAFLIANSSQRFTQNEDGTGDEYGLMPYLSEDGTNNIVVTNMAMYIGVSKAVEEDPQKREDAMKVMSFLATPEGQAALVTNQNTVSPLKGEDVDEDSPLYDMSLLINEGRYMGLVYSGWENYVVDIGEAARSMMQGEMTGDEFIDTLDTLQQEVQSQGSAAQLAAVEEDLTKEQTAALVGAAYATAVDADCALISLGDYHGAGMENKAGVNAQIYAGVPMTSDVVCTFNPLNWTGTIKTMRLTGAEIRQFAEEGYYRTDDPTPFPYVLVTKDGAALDDATTYTVAVVTESDERTSQGSNLTDTEVVGQDALVEYISGLGTINAETVQW